MDSSSFAFGIDVLLSDKKLLAKLEGRRVALLAHPASMTSDFEHALDALKMRTSLKLTSAFGPQHGMRGEKQDNMMESPDYIDPVHGVPVFSLYGEVRRPTPKMLETFDALLVDLQDVGTRIYTFLTTLLYVLEAGANSKKSVWILDRPNPAGRPVEGSLLLPGWTSFVGAGPLPMRHGLTLGEAAKWFVSHFKLDVDLTVVPMRNYDPTRESGYGWPLGDRSWVNPSPNAATLSMARAFPGTVMMEGTTLSEGRGTTRPLEMMGAPDIDIAEILKAMTRMNESWMRGCRLRPCHFLPTFQKHVGQICHGLQIHVDDRAYLHLKFQPYRLVALFFKAVREVHPGYPIWRDFHYEYENDRLAIDLINGGPNLREWVDNANATATDFDNWLKPQEASWIKERGPYLIYPS